MKTKLRKRINREFLTFMIDESIKSFAEGMGIRGGAYLMAASDYAHGRENTFIEVAKDSFNAKE